MFIWCGYSVKYNCLHGIFYIQKFIVGDKSNKFIEISKKSRCKWNDKSNSSTNSTHIYYIPRVTSINLIYTTFIITKLLKDKS